MSRVRLLPWTLIALLLAGTAHADLYKCRKHGALIYADRPCDKLGAETIEVLTAEKLEEKLTILPYGGTGLGKSSPTVKPPAASERREPAP